MQTAKPNPSPLRRFVRLLTVAILFIVLATYGAASLMAYNTISIARYRYTSGIPDSSYSDVTFPARGQTYSVHAFLLPGKPDMPSLIYTPGYNSSRRAENPLKRMMRYQTLGYSVLAIDLSDNGGDTSGNGRISMGYAERWDVLGAFDYLISQGISSSRIALVGESMGATTSLLAASLEPRIRAVWADSPYKDASTLLQEHAENGSYPILLPGEYGWGLLLAGDRIWEVRPIENGPTLAAQKQGIYLIATRADQIVPFYHGLDLYNAYTAAGVSVEFWDVPDLDHLETIDVHPDEYASRMKTFLLRYLQ